MVKINIINDWWPNIKKKKTCDAHQRPCVSMEIQWTLSYLTPLQFEKPLLYEHFAQSLDFQQGVWILGGEVLQSKLTFHDLTILEAPVLKSGRDGGGYRKLYAIWHNNTQRWRPENALIIHLLNKHTLDFQYIFVPLIWKTSEICVPLICV